MCEKLLSQVQIAGAGAGKTYSLAEKVLMWYDNKKDDKIIYVNYIYLFNYLFISS